MNDGLVNMAVSAKEKGKNPLDFLSDIKVPSDIKNAAMPHLQKAMSGVSMDDLKKFASSGAQGDLMNSIMNDGMTNVKGIFNDPGLQALGNDLAGNVLNQGAQLIGKLPLDFFRNGGSSNFNLFGLL